MDKLTDQQKAALLQQAQMAQSEAMQKAIASMSEHCFKICAGKKGESLDSSEVTCTVNCMDMYLETMQAVSQALAAKQGLRN